MAIQRATFVPKTTTLEFVYDKTFKLEPAALPTGTDPMVTSVLNISCNNLNAPIDASTSSGTWTAQEGAPGDSVEGLDSWVGDQGRYSTFLVLGAKIEVASDASTSTGTVPTFVNNYAVGLHKCSTGQTDIEGTTQLPTIQRMAYTRIRNATGTLSGAATGQTPWQGGGDLQGTRISDTYSARQWEGVTDVKDNKSLRGTALLPPTEGGKFQLFVASREPKSITKQVPEQLIRVKISYIVLLSDPLAKNNDPMNVSA